MPINTRVIGWRIVFKGEKSCGIQILNIACSRQAKPTDTGTEKETTASKKGISETNRLTDRDRRSNRAGKTFFFQSKWNDVGLKTENWRSNTFVKSAPAIFSQPIYRVTSQTVNSNDVDDSIDGRTQTKENSNGTPILYKFNSINCTFNSPRKQESIHGSRAHPVRGFISFESHGTRLQMRMLYTNSLDLFSQHGVLWSFLTRSKHTS